MASLDILRGLRPAEAKLFAEITVPDALRAQLQDANADSGKHSLPLSSVETCVWRALCDCRSVGFVSVTSSRTRYKALCFCCRAEERVFAACTQTFGTNPTPGGIWPELQPYGRGTPETLERKFLAWSGQPGVVELTDEVRLQVAGEEEGFLRKIGDSEDRQAALLVFADWLEDRGDARSELLRRLSDV